ncbi:hypothetical protein AB0M44_45300 [Streptosporangium subroseum]|uniref:hypothetical protein n=1 Tax=Streptosporangium subroseum TaxID=106412 RepID=UPI00342C20A2
MDRGDIRPSGRREPMEAADRNSAVAAGPASVEVEVLDDGLVAGAGESGFGLGGMAERVAACGG